jgi:Cu+-exporting ATPase
MSVAAMHAKGNAVAILRIEGMTCGVCSAAVERALGAVAGVSDASVSYATHVGQVQFDPRTASTDAMLESVEDIGFGAQLLEVQHAEPDAPKANVVSVAMLRIEGMTCGVCSAAVERALKGIAGVREASVSYATHVGQVQFDPGVATTDAMVDAVEDIGFGASLLEVQEAESEQVALQPLAVELRVRGMTCAACSGTIERHLQGLAGVERATVSLVLSRAFVVCDPSRLNAEAIREEIEDIGFDADVESTCASSGLHGRAHLHVKLCGRTVAELQECVDGLDGVLGSRSKGTEIWRITYDPYVVGARRLLARLREKLSIEWVNAGMENEQLQIHLGEMKSLHHSLRAAVPPALFVFAATILLPAVGIPHTSIPVLGMRVHGVDVFTLLMLILATPVQFCVAQRFHSAAWRALKRKSPNMDVLVSIATNVAYFYSAILIAFCMLVPDCKGANELASASVHFLAMGPILIAIVLFGKYLEAHAKLKAMQTLTDLPASRPETATLSAMARAKCSSQWNRSSSEILFVSLLVAK